MAKTYSGAYVVLAAAYSSDSAQGFLHPRDAPLTILCVSSDSDALQLRAMRNDTHPCNLFQQDKGHWPLFTRGWCMQERLVAQRIIYFLPHEMLFECQEDVVCECDMSKSWSSHDTKGAESFRRLKALRSVEDLSHADFCLLWASIVEEYSALTLVYEGDILPALSGITRSLEHLNLGKYIAGMWEHGLVHQLGWYASSDRTSIPRAEPQQNTVSHLPTFSWIASPSKVDFDHFFPTKYTPLCAVVSIQSTLVSPDPYGQISQASICLRGCSIPGSELILRFRTASQALVYFFYLDTSVQWFLYQSDRDNVLHKVKELEDLEDWGTVVCFPMFSYFSCKPHELTLLLLRRTKIDGEYVRVGIASHIEATWFDEHASPTVVTII